MLKIEIKNTMSEQFQLEYAVYMMLGSYFEKAKCMSKRVETKLFLHYQELGFGKQEKLENKVIAFIEKELIKGLAIPGMDRKEVFISFTSRSFGTVINLQGNDFAVSFAVRQKNGKLQYSIVSGAQDAKSLEWLPEEEKKLKRKNKVSAWIAA